MPKPLLLMDLDRTLFDTELFIDRVWAYMAGRYGLNSQAEKVRAPEYFDTHGDSYDYRFFDHVRASVGPDFDKEEFIKGAKRELSGLFLYPDATSDVLNLIDAILTFGNREYQLFKLSLCPELAGIEHHIVLEPKGAYIARTFAAATVLVDDKDLSGEIKLPAHFVRIDRSEVSQGQPRDHLVIHSLEAIPALMERITGESTNNNPYVNVKL